MVAEQENSIIQLSYRCSLAKISMVAERSRYDEVQNLGCSLAKISMVAERVDE